jgi:3-phosphoshikimate 1-carboxyvinyltransferase
VQIDGCDSQPVSALFIAASLSAKPLEIEVFQPKEQPWLLVTLNWLSFRKIPWHANPHLTKFRIEPLQNQSAFTYKVPKDFSSAAFPIAAAAITHSSLILSGLDSQDTQGDKILLPILESMGIRSTWDQDQKLHIHPGELQKGAVVDLDSCIDALPILAVLGCFAKTPTYLYNGAIAQHKESNRIDAISRELTTMRANIHPLPDGLIVFPSPLQGATLFSHRDHRIAMSLVVAALGALAPCTILDVDCITKTYPNFICHFQSIGASVHAYTPSHLVRL